MVFGKKLDCNESKMESMKKIFNQKVNDIKDEESKVDNTIKDIEKNHQITRKKNDDSLEIFEYDMEFCEKSLSYKLQDLLLIWVDETLRYNSPDPANVTLVFAVNNTAEKVFEKLMKSGDEFNVTCCLNGTTVERACGNISGIIVNCSTV